MTSPESRADRTPACKVEAELEAFHLGQLDAAAADEVRAHVATCASCAASLDEVGRIFAAADQIEVLEPSLKFRREMEAFVSGLERPTRAATGHGVAEVPIFLLSYAAWKFRTSRGFRVLALSAAAHAAVLLVLALVVLPSAAEPTEHVVRVKFSDEQTEPESGLPNPDTDDPANGEIASHVDEEMRPDRVEPSDKIPAEPFRIDPRPLPLGEGVLRDYPTDRVAAWMSGRVDDTLKDELVRGVYGDRKPLDAIGRALAHLAKTQEESGAWAPAESAPGYRTGVTALALLAFLGDGQSVHQGDHKTTVLRAAEWLVARQDPVDGIIRTASREGFDDDRPMYGHSLATYALVELYGLDYRFSGRFRGQLRRTIRFAIAASAVSVNADGGWRYQPGRGPSDASVTVWQMLALQAAQDAGFVVPRVIVGRAAKFLESLTDDAGAQLYKQDRLESTAALNAGALAVSRLLGSSDSTRKTRATLVAEARPDRAAARDPLAWFLATLALHRDGDERVVAWARAISPILLVAQNADGGWSIDDVRYGSQGGAAFATAMGALALQGAYREGGLE